jgi:hypothetical protein
MSDHVEAQQIVMRLDAEIPRVRMIREHTLKRGFEMDAEELERVLETMERARSFCKRHGGLSPTEKVAEHV